MSECVCITIGGVGVLYRSLDARCQSIMKRASNLCVQKKREAVKLPPPNKRSSKAAVRRGLHVLHTCVLRCDNVRRSCDIDHGLLFFFYTPFNFFLHAGDIDHGLTGVLFERVGARQIGR